MKEDLKVHKRENLFGAVCFLQQKMLDSTKIEEAGVGSAHT